MVGDTAVTPVELYVREVAAVQPDAVVLTASDGESTQTGVYRWSEAGLECLTPSPECIGWSSGDLPRSSARRA